MSARGVQRNSARALLALACLAVASVIAAVAQAEPLIVRAAELHVGNGTVLKHVAIRIEDGRIQLIAPAREVDLRRGRHSLRARVVTPGFIDVSTSAGLSGLRNIPAVLDSDEVGGPDHAALRAIDAFDPRDPLLRYLLEHGVTLIQTGPGPFNPIAGQAGIFRTHGRSADEMAVRSPSAMVFNLGEIPKARFREQGPTTRMGTASLIRSGILAGRAYDKKGGLFARAPEPDAGLEALARVASGDLPAIFRAQRADDILTALRLVRELELDATIAGATEAYLAIDALREADVPLLLGPVMERVAAPETENASYENAALVAQAGIAFALRSGFEGYVPKNRVLLFEAAIAATNGLGRERALRAITLDAAVLLGLEEDHGTVELGKVADLVLFDGDPFEYTSHVIAVVVDGEVVFVRPRHE